MMSALTGQNISIPDAQHCNRLAPGGGNCRCGLLNLVGKQDPVRSGLPVTPAWSSEGLQELDDGVLLGPFQFFELLGDVAGLAAMSHDRIEKCQGSAVMHQARTQADSP